MEFIKKNQYNSFVEREEKMFADMIKNPILKNSLKYHIENIDKARDLILEYVYKPIRIIGDYDSDGVNSCKGLHQGLTFIGATDFEILIPERLDGYGGRPQDINNFNLGDKDALIIFVDNGIVAFDAIKRAKELGYKVLVIDHHEGDIRACEADIVIDGHAGTKGDFIDYCSAGQVYKLWQSFAKKGYITQKQLTMLSTYAAIGTVGDMVNLIVEDENGKRSYDNWNIVKQGLNAMNDRNFMKENPEMRNLRILLQTVFPNYNEGVHLDYDKIAWSLVPVINAAGRIKSSKIPFEQLTTNDMYMIQSLAKDMVEYNEERKELKETYSKIALNEVDLDRNAIVYKGDGIPGGIVGLVAASLCEASKVPTLAGCEKDGIVSGSGRSPEGYDLIEILDKIQWTKKPVKEWKNGAWLVLEEGIPAETHITSLTYGGHANACGWGVAKEDLERLREIFEEKAGIRQTSIDALYYDFELEESEIEENLDLLEKNAPFGPGHTSPLMKINNYYPVSIYTTPKSFKMKGRTTEAIHFKGNMSITPTSGCNYNIYGTLGKNTYKGETTTQIKMIDCEISNR